MAIFIRHNCGEQKTCPIQGIALQIASQEKFYWNKYSEKGYVTSRLKM